jgi:hypothetical protein
LQIGERIVAWKWSGVVLKTFGSFAEVFIGILPNLYVLPDVFDFSIATTKIYNPE